VSWAEDDDGGDTVLEGGSGDDDEGPALAAGADDDVGDAALVAGAGALVDPPTLRVIPTEAQRETANASALARSAGLQAAVIAGVSELMKLVAEQMHLKSVSEQPVEPRAAIAGPKAHEGSWDRS